MSTTMLRKLTTSYRKLNRHQADGTSTEEATKAINKQWWAGEGSYCWAGEPQKYDPPSHSCNCCSSSHASASHSRSAGLLITIIIKVAVKTVKTYLRKQMCNVPSKSPCHSDMANQ